MPSVPGTARTSGYGVALLGGSAVLMNLPLPFVSWVGAIITGIYWFDVRPQLKSIIRGDYFY